MFNIFDTHCHPHLNKEKKQKEIISNFFNNSGKYMVAIGTNPKTNNKVIELSKQYSGVFSSIGIHPCDVYNLDLKKIISNIEKLLLLNKDNIVAIGECGLDYYWIEKDKQTNLLDDFNRNKKIIEQKEIQKIFFKAQLLLAKKYKLPVIIHNRNSKDDVFEILKNINFKNFIFHCYSENLEYAKKLIKFSPECKISFSGIVTFKSAKDIQETVKNIDIKHILAETDSPYLTPTPYRGKEENEPIFTKYIIQKINEIKGKDYSNNIFQNSLDVFGIKK